jgi:hypothetical protein
MTAAPDPFDLPGWMELSPAEQRAAVECAMKAGLHRELDLDSEVLTPDGWLTFTLRHRATGIFFRLVPGGSFERGFSDAEERALREELDRADDYDEDAAAGLSFLDDLARLARPVATVRVPPFLLSPEPLDKPALAKLLGRAPDGLLPGCLTVADGSAAAAALAAHGLRLPSEAEHEYAYRAGTSDPFPWGRSRPTSPTVPTNRFGLEHMAELSELCADRWHPGYAGAPLDGSARGPLRRPSTARGGSAEVWPWQGVGEWFSMLSAARSSSAEHDGFLRLRPARSLGPPR